MRDLIYILIIVGLAGYIYVDFRTDRLEKEKALIYQHDIQLKLDSTSRSLRESILVRNSLHHTLDSLLVSSTDLQRHVNKLEADRIKIKGRYNSIQSDSLAKLMEDRWKNGK